MAGYKSYILGEDKIVRLQILSTTDSLFVIKSANYKLTLNGEIVLEGFCSIDTTSNIISCQLAPAVPGSYQLDVTYIIGAETFIHRCGVIVTC